MNNDNYLKILNEIIDEEYIGKSQEEINKYKSIIKKIVEAEREYEFHESRPRINDVIKSNI